MVGVLVLVYGPSTLAKELETVNGRPLWYLPGLGGTVIWMVVD